MQMKFSYLRKMSPMSLDSTETINIYNGNLYLINIEFGGEK
jgi:hypothetical protein